MTDEPRTAEERAREECWERIVKDMPWMDHLNGQTRIRAELVSMYREGQSNPDGDTQSVQFQRGYYAAIEEAAKVAAQSTFHCNTGEQVQIEIVNRIRALKPVTRAYPIPSLRRKR